MQTIVRTETIGVLVEGCGKFFFIFKVWCLATCHHLGNTESDDFRECNRFVDVEYNNMLLHSTDT